MSSTQGLPVIHTIRLVSVGRRVHPGFVSDLFTECGRWIRRPTYAPA